MKNSIIVPSKKIEIIHESDICVIGGSCTGLFAAIRAARLGASVTLVEKQNCLGGVATSGLVNVWHSLYDINRKNQIISGLTEETLDKLVAKGSCTWADYSRGAYRFNPNDLIIELDKYIVDNNKIKLYLHSYYSEVIYDGTKIEAIIIDTKDGRKAIKAKFFIDATGEGDIARDLNIPMYTNEVIQNPTSCFLMEGKHVNFNELISKYGHEVGIPNYDWGWSSRIIGSKQLSMYANTHVFNVMCNRTDDLTFAEMEGRKQINGLMTLLNKYGDKNKDENYSIAALCSYIGIRETVHFTTKFKAERDDLMIGKRYESAILNGTYPIDIHDNDGGFKVQQIQSDYYQEPFELLAGELYDNFIAVGRMINADSGAFGALRVMVNLNQLGEASGVAAYIAVDTNKKLSDISGVDVRKLLKDGGSAL